MLNTIVRYINFSKNFHENDYNQENYLAKLNNIQIESIQQIYIYMYIHMFTTCVRVQFETKF